MSIARMTIVINITKRKIKGIVELLSLKGHMT